MTDRDLDRYLAGSPSIVSSSGFTANVMEAVRREATTPPIPFPWKRTIPGLAAAALLLVCFAVMALQTPITTAPIPRALSVVLATARTMGAGWIALALLISLVTVKFAKRLAAA